MYCHKCGTQISEGTAFCHKCGTKVVQRNAESQTVVQPQNTDFILITDRPQNTWQSQNTDKSKNTYQSQNTDGEQQKSAPKTGKEQKQEEDDLKGGTIALLLIGLIIVCVIIYLLRDILSVIFGVVILASVAFTLIAGEEEEKAEMRNVVLKFVLWAVVIAIAAFVIVERPDFASNIFQPGASVRNAYLTQYSEEVTVEDAFNNFFSNEKWSTYRSEGYSYVAFTGNCEYMGEQADIRITFKITGEQFHVDALDINGVEQNDFILALMLAKVYEEY